MRLVEAARVALGGLRANRLRSSLTMLGVVIGVAAVVVLVAIGTGTRQEVERQVEGLGSNLLLVFPGEATFSAAPTVSRLTMSDVEAVVRVVGDRDRVAVQVASGEVVRAGTSSRFTSVLGVLDTTPEVGAFAPAGPSLGVDRDDQVHIPVTTAHRLLGTDRVDALAVQAPDRSAIRELGNRIVAELSSRHPETQFSAVTQEEIIGVLGEILGVLTWVLAAIAGISLLVGGVGVSNIMLVSVRERFREIGLRKAVGARSRDIGVQFLLEAVLLTSIGGLAGIGLGIGAALLTAALSPVPAVVTGWSMGLAFGVSAGVGIAFGVAPAMRAARLDPVVALRTE